MGIISWFINQLMTGGAHPAELMSNHYQSCEIAIFSMRECLSISESTMIYSCQTSQGNVANKYVDQKNGYASTKKDKNKGCKYVYHQENQTTSTWFTSVSLSFPLRPKKFTANIVNQHGHENSHQWNPGMGCAGSVPQI